MRKQERKKMLAASLALVTAVGGIQTFSVRAEDAVTYKYVTMNVPYSEFYEAYNPTEKAVWNVNKNKAGAEALDAVTTATTSKCFATTGLAKGTYNDGVANILGVTIPVAVSETDYTALKKDLKETQNYYFTDLKETPKAYSTLTVADGKYKFSALQNATVDTSRLSVTDLVTTGKYGDYQISLNGVGTDGKLVSGEEYTIYGAVLSIDEKTYGMTCLENLWFGNKVPNVEIAWSIEKGSQKTNHGGVPFYQFTHNGGELKNAALITNLGVINIAAKTTLPDYYPNSTSGISLSLENDSDVLNISGIPSDLKNPKVSVSYTVDRNTVTAAEKLEVKDNKVALTEKAKAAVTYTVTISSDNYADINKTISTPMIEAQKTELQGLVDKAKKTTNYDSNTDLKEHVAEAEALIKDAKATSVQAGDLAKELLEKIKKTYSSLTIDSLTLKGSVLTVGLKEEISALGKASYTLTSGSGKTIKTLASGDFTGVTIVLKDAPELGTEYTLTIVSENYQDTTKRVTAEAEAGTAPTASPTAAPATEVPAASPSAVPTASPSASPDAVTPTTAPTNAPVAAETPAPTKKTAKITVKTTSKTVKAAKLKKKAITFSIGAKADSKGKLSYSRLSGSSAKLTISKTGKVTVKKKTKAGTYSIKLKIAAAANGDYKAAEPLKVTIKVKVK